MKFSSWLPVRKRHGFPRPRPSFLPTPEALDERVVPSTLTVTNNLDSGPGSLRAEIAAAKPGSTIDFAPSLDGETITLTSGELILTKNLTIAGPGAGQLTISGGHSSRVFDVAKKNEQVTLSGLTISDGTVGDTGLGGGVYNAYGASLTISGCTLTGNFAFNGGGIYNAGNLMVSNSTLTGNTAQGGDFFEGDGGGIYNSNTGTLAIIGSTLSDNSAGSRGGGLFNAFGGRATLDGCALTRNMALDGVAIYNAYNAGALTVSNSTFSDDFGAWYLDIDGPFTDGGGNALG